MGYHLNEIPRGKYGELSKIEEEVAELADAVSQGVHVMVLVELSDLLGAVEGYLERHYPNFTMHDLMMMHSVTKRAFDDGSRRSND